MAADAERTERSAARLVTLSFLRSGGAVLLLRALAAERPFLALERYDGTDRPAPPRSAPGAGAHV
jgi:hypothetical protein